MNKVKQLPIDPAKLMEIDSNDRLAMLNAIFCSCECDMDAAYMIETIAKYFVAVSDACGGDEPMYDQIADQLITIKKQLSR